MIKEIIELLNMFKDAKRIGNEEDIPEGTRYIQISDTLANQSIEKIDLILLERIRELAEKNENKDSCKTCEHFKREYLNEAISRSGEKEPLWSGKCEFLLAWLKIENSKMVFMESLCVQESFKCSFWRLKKNENT